MKRVIYSLALFLTLFVCGHAFAQDNNSHTKTMTVLELENGRVAVSQNGKFNVRQNINRTVTHLQATGKSHVTLIYDTVNYINVNCDRDEWNFHNDFIIVKGTTLLIDDPDGGALYEVHLKKDDLQFVNRTQQATMIYGKNENTEQLNADTVIINSFPTNPRQTTDNLALRQSLEDARQQLTEAKKQLRKSLESLRDTIYAYNINIHNLDNNDEEELEEVEESEEYDYDYYSFDYNDEEDYSYDSEERITPSFLWAFNNWGDKWYNGLAKIDGAYNLKTSFSSWQLEMQYAVIMTHHFNLSLGVGYELDIYKFTTPLVDIDANGNIHNTIDALPNQNYSDFIATNQYFAGTNLDDWSSRLISHYVSLPVTLGLQFNDFAIGFTALPALALNTTHTGLIHKLDTRYIEHRSTTSIGNQLAPYKVDLRVDMRFHHIGLFLQVATSPLFTNSDQDLYPIKFGFILK